MFQPWSPSQEGGSRDHLVRQYFCAGHKYKTILQFLRSVHGFTLSIRQLKRILKRLGLRRRSERTASHLRLVSRLIRVSYQKYLLRGQGIIIILSVYSLHASKY